QMALEEIEAVETPEELLARAHGRDAEDAGGDRVFGARTESALHVVGARALDEIALDARGARRRSDHLGPVDAPVLGVAPRRREERVDERALALVRRREHGAQREQRIERMRRREREG